MSGGTYKSFKTDSNREKDGIILDLGDAGKFKIARSGGSNDNFKKTLQRLSKPHRRAIQAETIDPKVADSILVQSFADAVLLGWEGVTGEDGKPLDFNKANAIKLLTDLPDLFRTIRETSEDHSLFRQDILETDAGNS